MDVSLFTCMHPDVHACKAIHKRRRRRRQGQHRYVDVHLAITGVQDTVRAQIIELRQSLTKKREEAWPQTCVELMAALWQMHQALEERFSKLQGLCMPVAQFGAGDSPFSHQCMRVLSSQDESTEGQAAHSLTPPASQLPACTPRTWHFDTAFTSQSTRAPSSRCTFPWVLVTS